MPRPSQEAGGSIVAQSAALYELVLSYVESPLAKQGITLGTFELLSAVRGAGKASQAEIARRLGIAPASLCEAVRIGVAKGLVLQEDAPSDRRAKRLALTDKGRKALAGALKVLEEAEAAMLDGIGDAKVKTTIDVLQAATDNLTKELHSA